jgi:FKBP-type peptidyl-prolyl cis-trans isomerase FkpA
MSVTAVPIRPLKRGSIAKLWIGIAALSLAAGAAAWHTTGGLRYEKTRSGAEYQVVENGEGASPGANDIAKVHVTIRERGRIVQNSRDGEPAEVPIAQLPPPISEVLQIMNKGSTYRVRLTPEQAGAPPGAARPGAQPLMVELTLVDFRTLSRRSSARWK